MREVVIADAVRTPITRAHPEKGWFRNIRSDELGVIVIRELLRRTRVDPRQIGIFLNLFVWISRRSQLQAPLCNA